MEKEKTTTTIAVSFLIMFALGWFIKGAIDKPKVARGAECQQLKVIDDAIIGAWNLDDPIKASYILEEKGKERATLIKKLGY